VKRSELQREQDALRVKFLQDNINLILSPDPESDLKLNALARIAFRENADGVIKQVADMRLRLPHEQPTSNDPQTNAVSASAEPEQDSPVPPLIIRPSAEMAYKVELGESDLAEGRAYVSRGDFKSALNSFSEATLNNPTNPLAWNFKAYAEFRTKQFDAALDSVTRAWKLKPVENRTRRFVAINATKILCAQGRADEAVTFFNKSAAVVPDIVADVYGDTEFQSTCKSIWKG
jgi:tetratricopeptide (TPR) repeat protein